MANMQMLDQWLERYNPLRGATLMTLSSMYDEADLGRYARVMWMARKMIRRDETIRACMRRIYAQLMKLDWCVKVVETLPAGLSQAQADAQRDYLKQKYEGITNLKKAYAASAVADFYGFAHLEKHYDDQGEVYQLQPVPQWHWVRKGIYGAWQFNAEASPYPLNAIDIDPANFVIREVDDPWIEIALIQGLRKNQNDRDWDGFCARYGIPSTFFIAPVGANDDKIKEFEQTANDMASDGSGVLPNGADVKTHESQQKGEVFAMKNARHDSAIVLAATGGLLTMLSQSGSGTLAGGAHSDTWRDLVSGIAAEVAECFQDQLDAVWLNEKFPGQPVAAYFDLDFPEEEADVASIATSVKTLKDAGYAAKRDWVEEETGIPLEEPDAAPAPPAAVPLNPALSPSQNPLKNRFQGGPSSARDRAEAMQLAETAIQDALDVTQETLAPLAPDIQALIDLAQNDKATADDFIALATKVENLLPELMTKESVQQIAQSLESAMGTAAAMGARATIRQRAAAKA